mgnify:CR=1 FL=1
MHSPILECQVWAGEQPSRLGDEDLVAGRLPHDPRRLDQNLALVTLPTLQMLWRDG